MNTLLDNEYVRIDIENNILIGKYKNSFIDLAIAEQVVNTRLKAMAGKKYPILIKMDSIKGSTKEARDYLASEKGCEGFIAAAICVDSIIENMVANFYVYLNKPLVPTKIFKDEAKAKEWLKQFVIATI